MAGRGCRHEKAAITDNTRKEVRVYSNTRRPGVGMAPKREGSRPLLPQHARHCPVLEAGSSGLLEYSHPLQVDRVATRFPNLTIVMAHMGNPWLIDCAAVLAKNQNVYADMSAFFAENRSITAHDVEVFKQRMEQVRVFLYSYEKFLFGTDYPLYSQKEYLGAVEALEMEQAEHEAVMHANAARLFGVTTS